MKDKLTYIESFGYDLRNIAEYFVDVSGDDSELKAIADLLFEASLRVEDYAKMKVRRLSSVIPEIGLN